MRWLVPLLVLFAGPAWALETMRIEMGAVDDAVELRAEALSFGGDSEDGPFERVREARVQVRLEGNHLTLNGAPWVDTVVRFRTGEAAVDAGVPGHGALHAGTWDVRGDVVVRVHNGRLQLINVIPLEDYVAAVLGGEMPVSFPMEALKAQAVAARTYALHRKLEALDQPYYLGSSVLAQVYGGVHREDPRTRAAVEATRGQVLTYELTPIEAYFHSSCGGRTESGLQALGRDLPYLQSVDCPCGHLAASRWSLRLPEGELVGVFHARGPLAVESRSSTGRARRVRVGDRSMDAVSFRQRVGYDRVKSLSFQVEPERGGAFLLSGKGYGHGAGLCQWGAKAYADEGWDYRRILAHYYTGTELQQLY